MLINSTGLQNKIQIRSNTGKPMLDVLQNHFLLLCPWPGSIVWHTQHLWRSDGAIQHCSGLHSGHHRQYAHHVMPGLWGIQNNFPASGANENIYLSVTLRMWERIIASFLIMFSKKTADKSPIKAFASNSACEFGKKTFFSTKFYVRNDFKIIVPVQVPNVFTEVVKKRANKKNTLTLLDYCSWARKTVSWSSGSFRRSGWVFTLTQACIIQFSAQRGGMKHRTLRLCAASFGTDC